MDLSRLTDDQRDCVRRVDGPLLVCAGAGSGKTFTLTQRIAYALLHPDESDVHDIDEVCAITFTEKAAGEIKARVKRTLRAEGMLEQASKVDGAWISTIHGMCSRILRSHALEIGIDPAFSVIGDLERKSLLTQAINDAVADANEIVGSRAYEHLFDEYPVQASFSTVTSVVGMVEDLVGAASQLVDGFDGIVLCEDAASIALLADTLADAYSDLLPLFDGTDKGADITTSLGLIHDFKERLAAGEFATQDDATVAFAQVYKDCVMPAKRGKHAEQIEAFQVICKEVAARLALLAAQPAARELMALAKDANERFIAAKHELGVFDNDDLLTQTLRALRDYPEVARDYSTRFKLVMVDEFQDTSQLQVDLISYIAGENVCHLCTVGDSQQSIYRFRGADVNVYEAHKRTMRSDAVGALYKELAKNFRSSADVLALVNRVFSPADVFGKSFMRLEPDAGRTSHWVAGESRIRAVVTTRAAKGGANIAHVRRAEALAIAQQFAHLQEVGMSAGDMVILLGTMKNANVYANAVREYGMKCVIAGGSLFSSSDDVQVVGDLVQAIYNPADTQALYSVLSSEIFCVSTDDLLCLATSAGKELGRVHRRNLNLGMAELGSDDFFGSWNASPSLEFARDVLQRAYTRLGQHALSEVVRRVLVESGWLARLEAEGPQGLARVGNVFKALRLIESVESSGVGGIASVATQIRALLATKLKEAPGTLNAKESDTVRIMTIHSSKGLEFPVVAVAEYDQAAPSVESFMVETFSHKAFGALRTNRLLANTSAKDYASGYYKMGAVCERMDSLARVDEGRLSSMGDALEVSLALLAHARYEELQESYRKLYVALTRASEALIVTIRQTQNAKGELKRLDQGAILAAALLDDATPGQELADYGGSEPAHIDNVNLMDPNNWPDPGEAMSALTTFVEPGIVIEDVSADVPYNPLREGVFSYSSISHKAHDEQTPDDADQSDVEPISEDSAKEPLPSAALDEEKATALGSAFHRAAQYAIETGQLPDASRLDAFAKTYEVSAAQRERLDAAVTRWFASSWYQQACAASSARAEVPFFVSVGEHHMEGEIDLLCTDETGKHALLFDYKTGGSPAETPEELHEKHLLQGQCYAYALLTEGFESVELHFVRVEQPQGTHNDDPQSVDYAYSTDDLDALRARIIELYEA